MMTEKKCKNRMIPLQRICVRKICKCDIKN